MLGVVHPPAEECGSPVEPEAGGRGMEYIPPQSLQKESALPAPRSWTSCLQNCERTSFCCLKSPGLWFGSPGKPTQHLFNVVLGAAPDAGDTKTGHHLSGPGS